MTTNFTINGKAYQVDLRSLPANITLNTFIREYAALPATKFMCQEGGCGVCVCVVTGQQPATGEVRSWAVNSCLTLLNSCADWDITTSEGLGNKQQGYHAIQQRLAQMNGTQCGYCSPGMVMNMYGLLASKGNKLTMAEIENSFGGNICRCTGYRPILDVMKSFAVDSNIEVPVECLDIEELCSKTCPKTGERCSGSCATSAKRAPMQFPDGSQWFWAKSLEDIFAAFDKLDANEQYMLVAGNTAHGVYRRSVAVKNFIDINAVPLLWQHSLSAATLTLGGNLSLTEAMEIFKEAAQKPGFEYCQQLWHHFDLIANVPVRNMGTLAGNLSIKHQHKEFPSDVFILFATLDVKVVINVSASEKIKVSVQQYLETKMYRKVISSFEFPAYSTEHFIFDSYKIMPRAQNAHAYVNAGFLLSFEPNTKKVRSARICFGGIHPDFVHATEVERLIIGKSLFDNQLITKLFQTMQEKTSANITLPEPTPAYRQQLAFGLLYKFLLAHAPEVPKFLKSGGEILKRPISSGRQRFETLKQNFPLTQPTVKHEGLIQAAGEATYANDLPVQPNQVWAAFVTAKKVGATIAKIDATEALKLNGVVAFYSAKDIPGRNTGICKDLLFFPEEEELFVSGKVKFYNQPLGVIVADSNALANNAAELVKITYADESASVFTTIQEVLSEQCIDRIRNTSKSHKQPIKYINTDMQITGSGQLDLGHQYHFFMEPHTTIAVPFEGGLQVHCATQWMDSIQHAIADVLNLRANEVQVKTRRLGGGFGGKGTRSSIVATAAALAAYKLNRPVRFVQSLESIMNIMGKRWPCHIDYEFFSDKVGKIVALNSTFYADAGYNPNESNMELTVIGSKNCYEFKDNFCLEGNMVLTDTPSNTPCRAPGTIEGIAMIENIMEHIAFESGLDPLEVRQANLRPEHKLHQMLPHFVKTSQYVQRRKDIEAFNKQNRWRKRGLGLAIMEYRMFYFGSFSATVAIYHGDGTVVFTHGGIEMGQGMNTKVAQVIAYTLGIPVELVRAEESETINGANSIVTGGSIGSESVCYAVRKCCNIINERLRPIKASLKSDTTWLGLIEEAYNQKVNLIASEICKEDDMEGYMVCALGLLEVEVDILTGNYQETRADILEDAGESLNPNIDVGQVEGAFIMGLGYWTTEHCVFDKTTGELLTNRTWNYKTPGAMDIPIDFRIELLPQSSNNKGFMRSKGSGEPAICLGVAVAFALQHALQSARNDAGLQRSWVKLQAPMTPEYIALNAGTDISMFKL